MLYQDTTCKGDFHYSDVISELQT